MPPLKQVLKQRGASVKAPRPLNEPLWKGPAGEGPLGGITFSMLSRYLVCKERFRVYSVEGLRPPEQFEAKMEFGSMWHAMEEALAGKKDYQQALADYCNTLLPKYPLAQEQIAHWFSFAEAMFPIYVEHWANHPDVLNRTPVLQERVFDERYTLPSGRHVRLRGKWDAVDIITDEVPFIFIQEDKTKSQIDSVKIGRQVTFDLQTMLYRVSLEEFKDSAFWKRSHKQWRNTPIGGVRYNVIRRSAHKSLDSLLKKIDDDTKAGRMNEWFDRWNINLSVEDVLRFREVCLNPILENLLDDYEWWVACKLTKDSVFDYQTRALAWKEHQNRHFIYPYGVYNILTEGGQSDIDSYLTTGSEVGLRRVETLFTELQDGNEVSNPKV